MQTYKICVQNTSGSINAVAQTQILKSGRIRSVRWCVTPHDPTQQSLGSMHVEVSPQSVSQIGQTGTINSIDEFSSVFTFNGTATQTYMAVGDNNGQRMLDYAITSGTVLYLNTRQDGDSPFDITCFVDVQ